jgi:hypothetical protein
MRKYFKMIMVTQRGLMDEKPEGQKSRDTTVPCVPNGI